MSIYRLFVTLVVMFDFLACGVLLEEGNSVGLSLFYGISGCLILLINYTFDLTRGV